MKWYLYYEMLFNTKKKIVAVLNLAVMDGV